ncbi:succinate dehydrogenase, hydrophobic membrane anchor protein [Luteimonas sp. FXH3W]|jgi:succinate dehydrogenase / fumarate reductase membrane anchor subunit|uniref:Succinate dehydrogenase hydrophobic membrane anchor subunit n=1 Tax=Aquilutibacter rugosus TaxID=3115820 RepID=A0ABU7UZT0_9GAMM
MSRAADSLRNPLKRARGLGSAKSGTGHFIRQRATAIAVGLFGLYTLGLILFCMTSDYANAIAVVRHPLNMVVLIGLVITMFWHAKLGLQVVVEDYVHTHGLAITLQWLIVFICAVAALAGVTAILRIALGA